MDEPKKASQEQLEQAQQLIVIADLDPETRLDCEGILGLGLEEPVVKLIELLGKYISEKETAYQEYKNTVREIVASQVPKTG